MAVDNSGGENDGDVFFSAGQNPSSVFAYGPLTYAEFFELKALKIGAGKGTVTSAPEGIDCGSICAAPFQEGSEVTLTGIADSGSKFSSWKGCDAVVGNECTVTISAKRQVTAKFNTKPAIEAENAAPLDTSAQLEATINPNGEETSYQFEFLSEDAYQANGESFSGPEEPLKTPAFPEAIGNGDGGVPVSAEVPDLTPGTPYRFRVVAANPAGESEGEAFAFTTYLPPNVFGHHCANDAFRTGPGANLPDCRAYEQASPIDKNGGDVTDTGSVARSSVSGDRVSFVSTSPLPGGESGAEFYPPSLASRGAGGWSTQGLLPPQKEGQFANVNSWTPDFSEVYAWARRMATPHVTTLLVRSSANGSVRTMVPHSPGFHEPVIAGTSTDGSVVFFEDVGTPGPLTPEGNAPANKDNLYVWDRETGVFRLAGIFNDGQAPRGGSFAGPYDWSGPGCLNLGGAERKNDTHTMHAISADGSSVYFTAGVTGQLYLRRNPTEDQSPLNTEGECINPALACTIQVSASQKHNGVGPEGNDGAGTQPAAFMGASTDGSVAFFTSPEMLTKKANTGPEQAAAQISRAKVGESKVEEIDSSFLPVHAYRRRDLSRRQIHLLGRSCRRHDRSRQAQPRWQTDQRRTDLHPPPGPVDFDTHPEWECCGGFSQS